MRCVALPGNTRLGDGRGYSKRTSQRLADELEEKGLMRRCYNGLNRRVGFDPTPLAMQQDMIEANIVEIQTKRKTERDELQLELSLAANRSEEHTSELQSLMRISYAVFCLKKKTKTEHNYT